jgi:endoglucanase
MRTFRLPRWAAAAAASTAVAVAVTAVTVSGAGSADAAAGTKQPLPSLISSYISIIHATSWSWPPRPTTKTTAPTTAKTTATTTATTAPKTTATTPPKTTAPASTPAGSSASSSTSASSSAAGSKTTNSSTTKSTAASTPAATTAPATSTPTTTPGASTSGSTGSAATTAIAGTGTVANASAASISLAASIFGSKLYVDPSSDAAQWVSANKSNPLAARISASIANQPAARWFVRDTDAQWSKAYVDGAVSAGAVPVLVAYNLPGRDCGSYSAGGAADATSYLSWITQMATGIGDRKAVLLLEPDSLFYVDCLDASGIAARTSLLQAAIGKINAAAPNTMIYLDGGSSVQYPTSAQMTDRLAAGGVARTRGFAVNINNFFDETTARNYGNTIVADLAARYGITGVHFVVDSSRNGNGSDGVHWCNPDGRAIGSPARWFTNGSQDGDLWFKRPGESDGACGLAPTSWSGDFVPALADALLTGAGR